MDELRQKRISELYQISFTEIHQFRNDTHKLFFGFIGLFTVLLGWVVTKEGAGTILQKACFTGGVLIISFFFFYAIRIMESYFLKTGEIINKIDKLYGFYRNGEYIPDDIILPKEWEEFGIEGFGHEPIFLISKRGVIVICLFAILLIWII